MLPILVETSWFTLYSYPIFLGLAWGSSYNYFLERTSNLASVKTSLGLYWGALFFSWLGAKLFFVMFSFKGDVMAVAQNTSFWLGGGFVFYGGFLAGISYLLFYSWFKKIQLMELLNACAPVLVLGHAIGRVGCVLAGCCYGQKMQFLAWSRFPTQLIESLFLFSLWYVLKKLNKSEAMIYMLSYSIFRFAIEFFRGDEIRGRFENGLTTSQAVSLGLFTITLLTLLKQGRLIKQNAQL